MEEERPRHNPDQVFHLVRSHLYESVRSFGQDLQGRLGARISWWHRDRTRPAHQNDTGNFCTIVLIPSDIHRLSPGLRWRVRCLKSTTNVFTSSRRLQTKCQTLPLPRLALLQTWKDMHAEEVEKHMFKFYFLQNGMAILNACTVLRDRLKPYRERMPGKKWNDWVGQAYFERVPLFASGFYATPGVEFEPTSSFAFTCIYGQKGRPSVACFSPFFYHPCSMSYQGSCNMSPSHNTQVEILYRPQLRSQDQHREVVRLRHLRRRLLPGGDRLPHRGPLRPQDGHRDGPGGEP